MGLWGGMADRLTGALCKNLIGDLLSKLPIPLPVDKLPVDNPLNNLGLGNLGGNKLPLNNLGGNKNMLVPGLLGRKPTEPPRVQQVTRRTTRGSLFGLPIDF